MLNNISEEILLLVIHILNQSFMPCSSVWGTGMRSSLDKKGKMITYISAVGSYTFLSLVCYCAPSDTETDNWLFSMTKCLPFLRKGEVGERGQEESFGRMVVCLTAITYAFHQSLNWRLLLPLTYSEMLRHWSSHVRSKTGRSSPSKTVLLNQRAAIDANRKAWKG